MRERASSFVGREDDLAALEARFDEGARLVTVLAPGGMGKTRLATRFAAIAREGFSDHGGEIFFVDLGAVTTAIAFVRALGAALDLPLERAREERVVLEAFGSSLARRKRILVVLDNFETALPEARPVLEAFTEVAPDVRWLVTSRVVLGLPGEHLVPLGPLALPAIGADREAALASPAAALFSRRAREVRPDLDPGADVASLVELLRRTDGIPLAVELAAARVAVLSIPEIAARLASPLDLLVAGHAEGRHASMRRAILDSLAPLDDEARLALARASVFRGGFDLVAAEAILGDVSAPALEVVTVLVRASLLRSLDAEGGRRFALFEVVRELVGEQLATDAAELERTRGRHAAHFAARARDGAASADDLDNLIAAHAFAVAHGGADALDLALGAGAVLLPGGAIATYLELLERGLAAGASAAVPELIGRALLGRGIARRELGEVEGPLADFDDVVARARALVDPALEAAALLRRGEIVETLGRTAEARGTFADALATLAAAPPHRSRRLLESEARARLAHTLRREGALTDAALEIDRAIRIRAEEGAGDASSLLYEAGVIALIAERHDEAARRFDAALVAARRERARKDEAAITSAHAILVQELGRLDEALAMHAEAARIFEEIGSRHRAASARYYLGAAFLERGATDEATRVLAHALERMRAIAMRRYEVLITGGLAVAAALEGRGDDADAWLASAEGALPDCASEPAIEAGLAVRRVHVALALGRRTDREAALAEARGVRARGDNDDVSAALRLLTRSDRGAPAKTLRVSSGAASFAFGPSPVDISRRAPLRRILLALAELHAAGEPLSLDDAVRAGWPGERMSASAAANRVRVALATLRKLGLKDAIVTAPGGYRIDPALAVVLDDR